MADMGNTLTAMLDTVNVTGRDQGRLEVWQATSVDEVRACIERARRERRTLYPISSGLNWGYGSAAPPQGGAVLLDLSGMRRILNAGDVSIKHPVVVIEPGVTQAQLQDFLASECPALTFNVTGSSIETSILGNALDRGVGYLGPRREDVFGFEIVTGRGEILKTGFRRLGEASPLAHTHPYGLGPMFDGLFFQSNFGVVTSACLKLVPRAPRTVAVSLALKDESRWAEFIDALALLKRMGVMSGVTHVGNRARTHASMSSGISDYLSRFCAVPADRLPQEAARALATVAPFEWTSLGGVAGSVAQVAAAVAEVRRVVRGLARVTVVDDRKLAVGYRLLHPLRFIPWARANAAAIAAIRPLHGLASGRPTDAAISNLLWRFGQPALSATQLDESNCGLLFVSPALPMDGAAVQEVIGAMKEIACSHGHELYVTVNIETTTSLVAVANLLFDRRDAAAVKQAHACAKALWQDLRKRGLEVYRARADMMAELADPADTFWRTAWDLKAVFDPDHVIAPGRYNLTEDQATARE
jgi:4-cresol dehydrogenase (hydroxylating) flavoprotein subunit